MAINVALIETFWVVGRQHSVRVSEADWGKSAAKELAVVEQGNARPEGIFRFGSVADQAVLRNLGWGCQNSQRCFEFVLVQAPLVLSRCKIPEEKAFISSLRPLVAPELDRQIRRAAFERTTLSDLKFATASRVVSDNATGVIKHSYLPDFLDLPVPHLEADLKTGPLQNLRHFLLELGKGFAFAPLPVLTAIQESFALS